jgi:hypothetical protein
MGLPFSGRRVLVFGTVALVAACGGGGGGGDAVSRFGQDFARTFRAPANAEPSEPGLIRFQGVVGPVLDAEPVDI